MVVHAQHAEHGGSTFVDHNDRMNKPASRFRTALQHNGCTVDAWLGARKDDKHFLDGSANPLARNGIPLCDVKSAKPSSVSMRKSKRSSIAR